MSTTRRAFSREEAVAALVRVYQGGRDRLQPVSLMTRIVSETDATVFETTSELTPESFTGAERAAEHRVRLPLGTLPAGEYLLTFAAQLDKRTARVVALATALLTLALSLVLLAAFDPAVTTPRLGTSVVNG